MNSNNLELNFRHMIAVRLVDAISFAAPTVIPNFQPLVYGFKLKITGEELRTSDLERTFKLHIEPAGWKSNQFIECFLLARDGLVSISQGVITSPWGKFSMTGDDWSLAGGHHIRETQLRLIINPMF